MRERSGDRTLAQATAYAPDVPNAQRIAQVIAPDGDGTPIVN